MTIRVQGKKYELGDVIGYVRSSFRGSLVTVSLTDEVIVLFSKILRRKKIDKFNCLRQSLYIE